MKLFVNGGKKIKGEVLIDGSKNSALPIIAATTLIKGTCVLKNVPKIHDVTEMLDILQSLGAKVIRKDNVVIISNDELSSRITKGGGIRANYYFLGALVSRYNSVEGLPPGGCKIGDRPIDIHIDAFRQLGYKVSNTNVIKISGEVSNYNIVLKDKSVGATINTIFACLNARKEVIIKNVLIEPEVRDVINFLNAAGFQIERILEGLKITPRESLNSVEYEIMPDRIEAMSYVVLGLLAGNITIKNTNIKCIKGLLDYLINKGGKIKITNNINVKKSIIERLDVVCDKYPGIPTDLNSILCVLMLLNNGGSVKDRIFPKRTKSIEQLINLNADIIIDKRININKSKLTSGTLRGYDLRGDMALLIAAISSKGKFTLELPNIERGYANIIDKLKGLKVRVKKI